MPELSTDGGETFITVDLAGVDTDEAIALEDAFGITWLDFLKGIGAGSAKSQKALVWLARRRTEPGLTASDVHYEVASFTIRETDAVPLSEGSAPSSTTTSSSSPSSST
jgi:hypothetical protein